MRVKAQEQKRRGMAVKRHSSEVSKVVSGSRADEDTPQ
jgi:hypothetical protein